MIKNAARLLIAGTGSGCGKTTVVCAILQALKNRGCNVASFKCGPDYIDPMFHSEIIGTPASNIDLYFTDESTARGLFAKNAAEWNLIEGVMGYYDGLAMHTHEGSSHHVAQALDTQAVLVVSVRGMALSAAAVVKGFQALRAPSRIAGVILNHASPMSYPLLKQTIEQECGIPVYGYLPEMAACRLESRHLGLVTAQEVENLREKLQQLACQAEKSIDLDALLGLMQSQPSLEADLPRPTHLGSARIAVARDAAFCFYYRDNLALLEELGAQLIPFSPLSDEQLPPCDGLYLGGGYPELHLAALSQNHSMLTSVRHAVQDGLPTVAECGGFMYLSQSIAGHPMVGVLPARCHDTGKLSRFGYVELSAQEDSLLLSAGESLRGHEFHYWDADLPGDALLAVKPSGRSWKCAHASDTLYAGYPHLSFHSHPAAARRFVRACLERKKLHEANGY